MYADVYYATLCHVCKEFNENLKHCKQCKKVQYCSKKHQLEDWPQHKKLCKIIACTNLHITYNVGCDRKEWKKYRIVLQSAWHAALYRELRPYECQMWMFPRVCVVCFSNKNITDCMDCLSVSYCSTEHEQRSKDLHLPICKSLKLCMNVDRYCLKANPHPSFDKEFSKALETIPKDINLLMRDYFNESVEEKDLDKYVKFILKTEIIAPGATILYALEKTENRESLKSKLVVHVVGASSTEAFLDWSVISEFLLHWLDNVTVIDWILVGLEMLKFPVKDHRKFCQLCTDSSKTFSLSAHNKKYHEIVDTIPKPDLVVAFNSGLHEFKGRKCDTWRESIPSLVKFPNVPLVLTAYTTNEMAKDLKRVTNLTHLKLDIILTEKNPFAGMRPLRDWEGNTITPSVFYVNGFISIVKRLE